MKRPASSSPNAKANSPKVAKCGPGDDTGFVVGADADIGGEEVPGAGVQDAGVDVQDTGDDVQKGAVVPIVACQMRITNGHNQEVCLFAFGTSKDKAQLVAISPKMCKDTEFNPRTACKQIRKGMQHLMPEVVLPLQSNQAQLGIMRKHAQEHRLRLLGC